MNAPQRTWVHLADWLEAEQREIFIGNTESTAARELDCLIELGEFSLVEKICREALERLPK